MMKSNIKHKPVVSALALSNMGKLACPATNLDVRACTCNNLEDSEQHLEAMLNGSLQDGTWFKMQPEI